MNVPQVTLSRRSLAKLLAKFLLTKSALASIATFDSFAVLVVSFISVLLCAFVQKMTSEKAINEGGALERNGRLY